MINKQNVVVMWCPAIRVNLTKRRIQLHPINQTKTSLSTKTETKLCHTIKKIHANFAAFTVTQRINHKLETPNHRLNGLLRKLEIGWK